MTTRDDDWVGPPRHTATAVVAAPEPVRPTPDTGRDRWFDLLRAAAIVRVVLYHMFPVAWLGLVFPAMGVMFALGGSLMARSVDRSAGRAVTSRLRRLLPALWVMAAVVVPAMLLRGWDDHPRWPALLLWLLPVAEPPAAEWAEPVAGVLWYLVTYLWLVVLSPALLAVYRRARLVTIVAPLVALPFFDAVAWPFSDRIASAGTDVLTFAACWALGFAHRDGDLRRVPWPVVLVVSAVTTVSAGGWVVTHGAELGDIPLAYGVYSVGFVLVLLRLAPRMDWLARRPRADAAVTLLNARAVTIYLWHNAAITLAFPLGDLLGVWDFGDTVGQIACTALAFWLIALVVLHIGWVEDVAARRRPRLVPV